MFSNFLDKVKAKTSIDLLNRQKAEIEEEINRESIKIAKERIK